MRMSRMKTVKSIEDKILGIEETLRKLKERCDKISKELDELYEEKEQIENLKILNAINQSKKTRAEILAFLER